MSRIVPFCPGLPYQRCSPSLIGREAFSAYRVSLVHWAGCLDFPEPTVLSGIVGPDGGEGEGRRAGDGC